jgi:hypothetical protein
MGLRFLKEVANLTNKLSTDNIQVCGVMVLSAGNATVTACSGRKQKRIKQNVLNGIWFTTTVNPLLFRGVHRRVRSYGEVPLLSIYV